MKAYKVCRSGIKSREEVKVLEEVILSDTFLKRLFGLLFKPKLKENQGLLMKGCNSIHTLWMRYPIDVVFLDKQMRIVDLTACLKPFRFSKIVKESDYVLELPCRSIFRHDLKVDDVLRFY